MLTATHAVNMRVRQNARNPPDATRTSDDDGTQGDCQAQGAQRTGRHGPGHLSGLQRGSYPHIPTATANMGTVFSTESHKTGLIALTAQRRSGRSEKGQGQVSVIRPRAGLSTPKKVLRAARAPRANAQTPTVRAWQGARHAHGGGVWGRGRGHLPAPASEEHMQGPASEERMQRGEREAPGRAPSEIAGLLAVQR